MDRFTVFMVDNEKSEECLSLDYLVKIYLDKAITYKHTSAEFRWECEDIATKLDDMTESEMVEVLNIEEFKTEEFEMRAPRLNKYMSNPLEGDRMFTAFIVEETDFAPGFLRPELAHQIFFEYSKREFTLAAFKHFCNSSDKSHPEFHQVSKRI
jgi:glycyl-tRNA synthetase (class II)